MSEPSDATNLNATERDLLSAIALAMEGGGPPRVADVRSIVAQTSTRFEGEQNDRTGKVSKNITRLCEYGYAEKHDADGTGQQMLVGLTQDGEDALSALHSGYEEAVAGGPDV